MISLRNLLFVLLITSFAFTACEKEEDESTDISNQPTTTDLSGFGNREGTPSGTAFQLPDNVELTTQIVFSEYYNSSDSIYQQYGVGQIKLLFTINNNNNSASTIEFPAGLIFIADTNSAQDVMTIYPVTITLPAKGTERVKLMGYCINMYKNVALANYFTLGVVSNNDQVSTLINNLSNIEETILLTDENLSTLQTIVWDISDGDGLSQADLDTINSWKN